MVIHARHGKDISVGMALLPVKEIIREKEGRRMKKTKRPRGEEPGAVRRTRRVQRHVRLDERKTTGTVEGRAKTFCKTKAFAGGRAPFSARMARRGDRLPAGGTAFFCRETQEDVSDLEKAA